MCGLVHIRLADSGRESLLCISSVIIMQAPCGKEAKRAKRPQTGVPVVEVGLISHKKEVRRTCTNRRVETRRNSKENSVTMMHHEQAKGSGGGR